LGRSAEVARDDQAGRATGKSEVPRGAVEGVRDGNAGGTDGRLGCGPDLFGETGRRALAHVAAPEGRSKEKERGTDDSGHDRGVAGCAGRPTIVEPFDYVSGIKGFNPCRAETSARGKGPVCSGGTGGESLGLSRAANLHPPGGRG